MTDVKLFQTDDEGDINVVDGIVEMSGGLETAAYLSLFGGNEGDDGRADNPLTWWGNIGEQYQYRSETQHLLRALAATTGNLRRIEDAAVRDLAWMTSAGAASSVSVAASIPGLNRIKLTVNIDGDTTLEFVENWKASV